MSDQPYRPDDNDSSSDPYRQAPQGHPGQGGSDAPGQGGSDTPPYGADPRYPAGGQDPQYGAPQYGSPEYGAPQQSQTPTYGGQPGQTGQYGAPQYGSQSPYAQPYGYAQQLDPEQEKARSAAILWTILNGVAIFLTGNLFAIGGVVLAGIAITKAREDVQGARSLVRWSWILFAAWYVVAVLAIIVLIVVLIGTASVSQGF